MYKNRKINDDEFDDVLNDLVGDYQPSTLRNRSAPKQEQKKQEVDDLLDFIEDTEQQKKPPVSSKLLTRPQTSKPTYTADNFFNELEDEITPVQNASRRQRPESANKLDNNSKNRMAELFGIKPPVDIPSTPPSLPPPQPAEQPKDEINTLDIGVSRRRDRRVLSKKDDQDSQNKSVKDNLDQTPQQHEEIGSIAGDDLIEMQTSIKSRLRPPLNKRQQEQKSKPLQDSLNQSKNDQEQHEVPRTQILEKSFNDLNQIHQAERSFDKMSGLLAQEDSVYTKPLDKQHIQPMTQLPPVPPVNQQLVSTLQQQITFLENQIKDIKQEEKEKIQQMESMHNTQLENERKSRIEIVSQLQDLMEKERKRMQESHKDELDRLRRESELDKQRAIDLIKHEPLAIKQQIEQQFRLNELAEQIKSHTQNLQSLQKQIEHNNSLDKNEKHHQLLMREQNIIVKEMLKIIIQELEKKLQSDINYIQEEKLSLKHQQEDIQKREQKLLQQNEIEKQAIRNELKRLHETQDQIRSMEIQHKKLMQIEREQLDSAKETTQKQSEDIHRDYLHKLKALEVEKDAFEQQKLQFKTFADRNNEQFTKKIKEIDEAQERLTYKESELFQKQRESDLREQEIAQMHKELTRKLHLLDQERTELHHKLREISQKELKVSQDMVGVENFKQTYLGERGEIDQMRQDISSREKKLQYEKLQVEQEKRQLNMMHQTLSNIRSEMVPTQQSFGQSAPQGFGQSAPQGFGLNQKQFGRIGTDFSTTDGFKKTSSVMQPKIQLRLNKSQNKVENNSSLQKSNDSINQISNYVNFLKQVDQQTGNNQIYHIKERSQLTQSNGFN